MIRKSSGGSQKLPRRMSDTGVENLTLSRGPTHLQAPCSLCGIDLLKSADTYYFQFEIKEEAEFWAFHDTCFYHIVFAIREFLDKNGIKIPEEFSNVERKKN